MGDGKIFQMGIRSGDRSEFEWAKEHLHQCRYNCDNIIEQTKGKPVYVTIDLDVLDPSVFPGTGTPEPSGSSTVVAIKTPRELLLVMHK